MLLEHMCGMCPHPEVSRIVHSSLHSDQLLLLLNSGKLNLKTAKNLDLCTQNKAEWADLNRRLRIFGSCSCVFVLLP